MASAGFCLMTCSNTHPPGGDRLLKYRELFHVPGIMYLRLELQILPGSGCVVAGVGSLLGIHWDLMGSGHLLGSLLSLPLVAGDSENSHRA